MLRTLLVIIGMSFIPMSVIADSAQISSGVRVRMNTGNAYDQERKNNPDTWLISVYPHPPIASFIASGTQQRFTNHIQMLEFFRNLPPFIQEKGLWITPTSVGPLTGLDRDRLSALTHEAKQMNLLMFICEVKQAKTSKSTIAAWGCAKASPRKDSKSLSANEGNHRVHRDILFGTVWKKIKGARSNFLNT